ncbi:MAG: long-chain fatty acid--CoA ligase [Actinobacteria bacterium]|nr:MAG: long-chain fatty acid--CoA ligase [Actinomycetota bacterium]
MNFATIADRHPESSTALVSQGKVTTYGQLRRQVEELRGGLVRAGLQPGDRLAIATANTWFFVVSYLATLGVGGVAVPLNPQSPPVELEGELAATGARVAVVGPRGRDSFAGVDRMAVELERVLVPEGVRLDAAEPLEELFGGDPAPCVARDEHDDAVLMFTAGTAGPRKAARLTHGNLLANLQQVQAHPGLVGGPEDVALGVLPLFHIFGLNAVLGLALYAGSSVVLLERFDPASSLEAVREHGITVVAGAPPLFGAWASVPGVDASSLASVRLVVSGGAPLADEVADAFQARFDRPIWQGYGLTETSPIVSSSLVGGEPRRGSIGIPLPGVDVRLVDSEGEDALAGDPGEVWVRGANVFPGYWNDPEATAMVLTEDGWLKTGDIAVTDDDGYLYLVDRAKDLIIVSGFNVFPAEVEEVLLEHPGIAEAGVVGVSHPYTGEAVKAYVVPKPGRHLEEDEVIEFCAERLARYKCPTSVSFVDQIPQGLVGKVLRRALRGAAGDGQA